jgi:hypothetical protein
MRGFSLAPSVFHFCAPSNFVTAKLVNARKGRKFSGKKDIAVRFIGAASAHATWRSGGLSVAGSAPLLRGRGSRKVRFLLEASSRTGVCLAVRLGDRRDYANSDHARREVTTPLEKTLKRALTVKGREYVVAISPEGLKLTAKGKRNGVELGWESLISGEAALAVALRASLGTLDALPNGPSGKIRPEGGGRRQKTAKAHPPAKAARGAAKDIPK